MHVVVDVLLSILGVLLIVVVFDSALRTFVLPAGSGRS